MSRLGDNMGVELNNMAESGAYKQGIVKYKLDAAGGVADVATTNVANNAIEGNNSAIARFAGAIAEPAGRAAQLTQQYQTQLAQAYVTLAESLSSASSAIASGKMGRFRASKSLNAKGENSFRSRMAVNTEESSSATKNEDRTCRVIFKEMKY
jgi:hypothetical protein